MTQDSSNTRFELLSETSASQTQPVPKQLYERKVGFLTRPQAAFARQVMTRIACDPHALAALGIEQPGGQAMAKRIAGVLDKKIDKRDEAMRAKGYGTEANPDPDMTPEDQPFEELDTDDANEKGFLF